MLTNSQEKQVSSQPTLVNHVVGKDAEMQFWAEHMNLKFLMVDENVDLIYQDVSWILPPD